MIILLFGKHYTRLSSLWFWGEGNLLMLTFFLAQMVEHSKKLQHTFETFSPKTNYSDPQKVHRVVQVEFPVLKFEDSFLWCLWFLVGCGWAELLWTEVQYFPYHVPP